MLRQCHGSIRPGQANVPDGLYEMWVGYDSPYGRERLHYQVDSVNGSGMFDSPTAFTGARTAPVCSALRRHEHAGHPSDWGYYNIDYLEFRPYTPPTLLPITTPARRRTGRPPHADADELSQVASTGTKRSPACSTTAAIISPFRSPIISANRAASCRRFAAAILIDYSPSRVAFGENPQNETEQTINWAQADRRRGHRDVALERTRRI